MQKRFSIKDALSFGFSQAINNFGLMFVIMLTYAGIILAGIIIGLILVYVTGILGPGIFSLLVSVLNKSATPAQIKDSFVILTIFSMGFVGLIALLLAETVGKLGIYKIGLELYDDHTATYKSFFNSMRMVRRACLASLLLVIPLGLLGFSILIANVIFDYPIYLRETFIAIAFYLYWKLGFFFYPLVIVDEDAGIRHALKRSREITKGVKLRLRLLLLPVSIIKALNLCAISYVVLYFVMYFLASYSYPYIALVIGYLLFSFMFILPITMLATVYVYRKLSIKRSK